MKFSFMSFSTPEPGLEETLSLARRLGYDGIEPRLEADHAHGIEVVAGAGRRQKIRRMFLDSGVAPACLATSCRYADPENNREMVARTHECIDLAGDVGAPRLRVFGGHIPDGMSRAQAIDLLVQSLSSVADHAAERGVTLCLETHDAWCDPRHVAQVLRRLGHQAVGANWDVMHPVRGRLASIDEAFDVLKPWIRHLHVHDGATQGSTSRLVPIGTGDVDHKRIIALLKTISYDGYLSGEWINWEPYQKHLPRELAALKAFEQELE